MATVLVTGATGRVGRLLVPRLAEAGHDVRAGTRSPRDGGQVLTDFTSPGSLRAAVEGVDVIVHLATNPRAVRAGADDSLTRELLAASPGVAVILLSIVGCDRTPFRYYRAKHRAEQLVQRAGGVVVRATQFHGFAATLTRPLLGRSVVPRDWRVQPVAEDFVAQKLVEAVASPRPVDLSGPEELTLAGVARRTHRAKALEVPVPGAMSRAVRGGSLLPGPDAVRGGPVLEPL